MNTVPLYMYMCFLYAILILLVCFTTFTTHNLVHAATDDHQYQIGEEVTLWASKTGPYHNPQESYSYYSLPFCQPTYISKEMKHQFDGLGSILEGHDLIDSGLHIKFRENLPTTRICDIILTNEAVQEFEYAVNQHYWFQMYIDELPIWGMVGEIMQHGQEQQAFIYTHKAFSISYNGNQIIHVNLTSEKPKLIVEGETYATTYSVTWTPTTIPFEQRFDIYLDTNFFEHQIHWFSIFNAFMMVIFLCGLVALILLRTLRSDYARFSAEAEDLDLDRVVDESGWKQVHGDVFRAPPYLMILSALYGTGIQLVTLVFCVLLFATAGSFYSTRGATLTAVIVCYSLTAFCGGFCSSGYYKRYNQGEDKWKQVLFLTGCLFPTVVASLMLFLNFIAIIYSSSAAIPFGTMLAVLSLWIFVTLPLTALGTLVGRNFALKSDFPCRVNNIRRPIPEVKWYMQPWLVGLIGGILPFGSIFIEMYFVFTSFWNSKFYYLYGFCLLVFCILFIVTICVTIVVTYLQLNNEDYRWQWNSFFSAGSTALYVYTYAIYYFFFKTHMFGFFQTIFYFGHMLLFCITMFILTGSIGHFGASMFVNRIYMSIKSD